MSAESTSTTPPSGSIWRLGVFFVLGAAAALSGLVFGMPGNGEFVPAIWLAAFIALLVAPGRPGNIGIRPSSTNHT